MESQKRFLIPRGVVFLGLLVVSWALVFGAFLLAGVLFDAARGLL